MDGIGQLSHQIDWHREHPNTDPAGPAWSGHDADRHDAWTAAVTDAQAAPAAAGRSAPGARSLMATSPDQAAAFTADPFAFGASHFINTANPVSPGTSVPASTPGQVADGSHAQVSFGLTPATDTGAVNLHVNGPATPGQPAAGQTAYYVPFTPGQTNGVSVPAHPDPAQGQPTVVLTGALTGCSFYATPDPHNSNNIIFSHASQTGSSGSSAIPANGVGVNAASYGPQNFSGGSAGNPNLPNNAASAFAYYQPDPAHAGQGQWHIVQQDAVFGDSQGGTNPTEPPTLHAVGAGGNVGGLQVQDIPVPVPEPEPGAAAHGISFGQAVWAGASTGATAGGTIGAIGGIETGPLDPAVAGGGAAIGGVGGGLVAAIGWLGAHSLSGGSS